MEFWLIMLISIAYGTHQGRESHIYNVLPRLCIRVFPATYKDGNVGSFVQLRMDINWK